MEREIENGSQVAVLECRGQMLACDINPSHALSECFACISRRRSGMRRLSQPVKAQRLPQPNEDENATIAQYAAWQGSLDELQQLKLGEFDIGYAVLSSLISMLREPEPDLQEHKDLLAALLWSSAMIYLVSRRIVRQLQPDKAIAYNGRYGPLRAFFRACQHERRDCFLHERGSSPDHYMLFKNSLPHNAQYWHKEIMQTWLSAEQNPERRDALADNFFRKRADGKSQAWLSFVAEQKKSRLPEGWDTKKHNVVFFNSSEDEFAAIGGADRAGLYASQFDGLKQLLAALGDDENMAIYLRVHPNLKGIKNSQTKALESLSAPNFTKISAASSISSYAVLFHADLVVTFGSTMGIEAVYWNKASVLLGPAFYRALGGTYQPRTHEEAVALLRSSLEPKNSLPARQYGFYMAIFGERFRFFKADGLFRGRFRDKRVRASLVAAFLVRVAKRWPGRVVEKRLRSLHKAVLQRYAKAGRSC